MKKTKFLASIALSSSLLFTSITPAFAETVELEQPQQNNWYHVASEAYKESLKNSTNLSASQIVNLVQMKWMTPQEAAKKIAKPSYDTASVYTDAVAKLVAAQQNPYAYQGVNYLGKLAGNQTGEGYFTFDTTSTIDKKIDSLIKSVVALEQADATYNKEAVLARIVDNVEKTDKGAKIKGDANGVLSAQVAYILHLYDKESDLKYQLISHFRDSTNHFAQGLGAYVSVLYAMGEDPLDAKWNIGELSVAQAYEALQFDDSGAFKRGLNNKNKLTAAADKDWALLGLASLHEQTSLLDKVRQDFATIEFDFSPKTIAFTTIYQPYVAVNSVIAPKFSVKDQYGTEVQADVTLQSADSGIIAVNEHNELVAKAAGTTTITATAGEAHQVLRLTVTADETVREVLPKFSQASHYLQRQDKFTSFEEVVASKTLGYTVTPQQLNIYTVAGVFNAARNVMSILAADENPATYNNKDYIAELQQALEQATTLSEKDAAYAVMAQTVAGVPVSDKALTTLADMDVSEVSERDLSMVLQAVTVTTMSERRQAEVAEDKMMQQQQALVERLQQAKVTPDVAVALLNYHALQPIADLDVTPLVEEIVKNQYDNKHITNGGIKELAGDINTSTAVALNALSTLLTKKNAYVQLADTQLATPTTILLDVPTTTKINEPLTLQAKVLDQNGQPIAGNIVWSINGEAVTTSFTPTTLEPLEIVAKVGNVTARQTVNVIDYQRVHSVTLTPLQDVVTDKPYALQASVTDSENQIVDEPVTFTVTPTEGARVEGNHVVFDKAGTYRISAQAGNVSAKSQTVNVAVNPDAIHTKVTTAVANMKNYLETRKQYDYISALAYANVMPTLAEAKSNMREIGHLREYGNHDEKYALYYAKNIVQAVAASEDATKFPTYKGQVVDLQTTLVNAQDEDGHFTMFANFDKPSVTTQVWSIIALDLLQASYNKEAAIADLLKGLNGPLSEGSYKEQELRALSLIALAKHRTLPNVEQQIQQNLTYLKAQQNDDGGFNYGGYTNNPFAIGTVIQGLMAVGENPYDVKWKKNGVTMVEVLLRQQLPNGGFKFGDEFEAEVAFDELKSTEAAFGALADLLHKRSIFNQQAQIIDSTPLLPPTDVKPFIEVEALEVEEKMPLLSLTVAATDNVDGDLELEVFVNEEEVYSATKTYKAVLQEGPNEIKVTTTNRAGNTTTETMRVSFAATDVKQVPQATLKIKGLKGQQLKTRNVILEPNDTAYSVLVKAVGKPRVKARNTQGQTYVTAIQGLKELDHGEGSGWMYSVNGTYPTQYAGEFTLKDGDRMEWSYTENYGKDLGVPWLDTKPTPTPKPTPPVKPEPVKNYVAATKTWKVVFSQNVRAANLQEAIYVTDATNRRVAVNVVVEGKTVYVNAPAGGYNAGDYTLHIAEQTTSATGKGLAQQVTKDFSVK